MTEYIIRLSEYLQILIPIFCLLVICLRIYIESRDVKVLKELRAFRCEFSQHQKALKDIERTIKQMQDERQHKKAS